ncbi:hypothetical protein M413DRAFT_441038 [Hebeloma cylindrosporum]|uniref:Uncharacterized protein n=1 Tax=Hebeloma cylindrosporum TaxID=76867 RepID=A0A0C3CPD9_HEBCY|nr:hypothetical protein M413DRAFT_441038 [Hebeloma cylindrosporum h7]
MHGVDERMRSGKACTRMTMVTFDKNRASGNRWGLGELHAESEPSARISQSER